MENLSNLEGIQELNDQEKREIIGGDSFWYHLGYLFGRGFRAMENALDNPPDMPSSSVYK